MELFPRDMLIKEYEKLKDEQRSRIEFRDHMIFLTLGANGAVFSFALEHSEYYSALLILPFVCIVLGWTYLTNDEKITSISNYLRTKLFVQIDQFSQTGGSEVIYSWEDFLKRDIKRKKRKVAQFVIDISLFILTGLFSITSYFFLSNTFRLDSILISIIEFSFLVYLAKQFFEYADF
jgi:hypothetical protein